MKHELPSPPAANDQRPAILLVEDNESEGLLALIALKKAGVTRPALILQSGLGLVHYLNGLLAAGAPLPGLIFLDLNMPGMNGFDVLQWLQGRSELQGIPVVVLSSSDFEADMACARRLGARDYRIKPRTLAEFVSLLKSVERQWLEPDSAPSDAPPRCGGVANGVAKLTRACSPCAWLAA